MISNKQYKVELLDGRIPDKIFETRQEAVREYRGNISKLIEYLPRETKKVIDTSGDHLAILISARSNEDLDVSLGCGYAVMYNCPKRDKIYEGMRYLEVSDDYVLEAVIDKLEKYEKGAHPHWKGPGYRPDKEWKWAIYHKNGKLIKRETAEQKYSNSLKGTQGGISYIKL